MSWIYGLTGESGTPDRESSSSEVLDEIRSALDFLTTILFRVEVKPSSASRPYSIHFSVFIQSKKPTRSPGCLKTL